MKKLAQRVVKLLSKRRLKISFAESCTGCLLSSSITSISGSSKIFTIGFVTYSNQAKIKILKVPKKIIMKHGAVSYETCLYMVKNLNKISKTNISVSITGVAGPKGGTKLKPIGLVYIGIKKGNKVLVKKNYFKNNKRSLIQKATVNKALNLVLSFTNNKDFFFCIRDNGCGFYFNVIIYLYFFDWVFMYRIARRNKDFFV